MQQSSTLLTCRQTRSDSSSSTADRPGRKLGKLLSSAHAVDRSICIYGLSLHSYHDQPHRGTATSRSLGLEMSIALVDAVGRAHRQATSWLSTDDPPLRLPYKYQSSFATTNHESAAACVESNHREFLPRCDRGSWIPRLQQIGRNAPCDEYRGEKRRNARRFLERAC